MKRKPKSHPRSPFGPNPWRSPKHTPSPRKGKHSRRARTLTKLASVTENRLEIRALAEEYDVGINYIYKLRKRYPDGLM